MARLFNGSTDYIEISSAVVSSYPLTISAWAMFSSFPASGIARVASLGKSSDGQNYVEVDYLSADGHFRFVTNNNGANQLAEGTLAISTNVWYHLCAVHPGVDGTSSCFLYTNGGDKQTGAPVGANSPIGLNRTDIAALNIVGVDTSTTFPGRLADVAFWNVALTDAEVLALSTGVRPNKIRPSNLAAYWPLDGLASPEPDLSGNKNNGTITGTPSQAAGPPISLSTPKWHQFLPPRILQKVTETSTIFTLPVDCVVAGNHPEEKKSKFITDFRGILRGIFRE